MIKIVLTRLKTPPTQFSFSSEHDVQIFIVQRKNEGHGKIYTLLGHGKILTELKSKIHGMEDLLLVDPPRLKFIQGYK